MNPRSPNVRPHRGAALLLVLALVVATVPVIAIAASRVSVAVQAERSHHDGALADDLVQAASVPILDWLRRDSTRVVLPPGITQPMVAVFDDTFQLSGLQATIRATAWDLHGMLPADAVRGGTPLQLLLADDVRARLGALDVDPAGLDAIPQVAGGRLVFPSPSSAQPALGAMVATAERPSAQPTVRLNANTTPAPLLAQALRLAGRGGFEQIMDRRARGEHGGPPPISRDGGPGGQRVQITSSSESWGIRIDIAIGGVRRSWWTVWTRVSGDWMLQRRTPILWEPHPEPPPTGSTP